MTITSQMKLGWSCPQCRILLDKKPDMHAPLCGVHRIAYHRVIHVEERVDDKMEFFFIDMEAFGADQRNILELFVRKINSAFEWIQSHEHATPLADEAYIDMVKAQINERCMAIETRLDAMENPTRTANTP